LTTSCDSQPEIAIAHANPSGSSISTCDNNRSNHPRLFLLAAGEAGYDGLTRRSDAWIHTKVNEAHAANFRAFHCSFFSFAAYL